MQKTSDPAQLAAIAKGVRRAVIEMITEPTLTRSGVNTTARGAIVEVLGIPGVAKARIRAWTSPLRRPPLAATAMGETLRVH